MGTTKTAIETGGCQLVYVMAIEGYEHLLTSHDSAAAVVTAWSGSEWTSCKLGLETPGDYSQGLKPFRPRIEVGQMTFRIHPDTDDTFATDVYASEKNRDHAYLQTSVDRDDGQGGIGEMEFDNVANLPAAPGRFNLGTESVTFVSKDATNNTVINSDRGRRAPFTRNSSDRFSRNHTVSRVADSPVSFPLATDYYRFWTSRHVGVWAHRVVGGVLDVKAQAELIFSGSISAIAEEGGVLILSCSDFRDVPENKVLLDDQYSAYAWEGFFITEDDKIEFREVHYDYSTATPTFIRDGDDWFTLQAGSGAGLNIGWQSSDEIVSSINDWLSSNSRNDSAGADSFDLYGVWTCFVNEDNKVVLQAEYDETAHFTKINVRMTLNLFYALGFGPGQIRDVSGTPEVFKFGADKTSAAKKTGDDAMRLIGEDGQGIGTFLPTSQGTGRTLFRVQAQSGTFIDQSDWLPEPWRFLHQGRILSGGNAWGFMKTEGGQIMLVEKLDDTLFRSYDASFFESLLYGFEEGLVHPDYQKATWRKGQKVPEMQQILLIEDDVNDFFVKLFASTGTDEYNHATWDKYPRQLALGIPWDVLGDEFVNSVQDMTSRAPEVQAIFVIDKPMKASALLTPEMQIRNAHLISKSGKLVFQVPSNAGASAAAAALGVADTAYKVDEVDSSTATSRIDRDLIVNHVKVEYQRNIKTGQYHRHIDISNPQSKTETGVDKPLTLRLPSSLTSFIAGTGAGIKDLASHFAAYATGLFNRAPTLITRTLPMPYFTQLWPGDVITMTDNHIRDPNTGTRGITAKAMWISKKRINWQNGLGEIECIMLPDQDLRCPYSPAGEIDESQGPGGGWSAGYNSGTPAIQLKSYQFHRGTSEKDIESFAVGDNIYIHEISPGNPRNPDGWERNIDAIDIVNSRITLDSTLTSPAWDANKNYRVISRRYSDAETAQQSDAYMAGADNEIQDSSPACVWGSHPVTFQAIDSPVVTELHELPIKNGYWHQEGYPVTPALHRSLIDSSNNMYSYRCRAGMPFLLKSAATTQSVDYVPVLSYPKYVHFSLPGNFKRQLHIAPRVKISNSASTVSIRVTMTKNRPSGTGLGAIDFSGTSPSSNSVEFTHTGTATDKIITEDTLDVSSFTSDSEGQLVWITVEMKVSNASHTGTFYGFSNMHLGPVIRVTS